MELTKQHIIVLAVIVVVGAPIAAWALVSGKPSPNEPQTSLTPATSQELFDALRDNEYRSVSSVISSKRMHQWWYVVTVKTSDGVKPVLMSKFDDTPKNIRVVTEPGEPLPYKNISGGLGVPYDVIDELNKQLGAE